MSKKRRKSRARSGYRGPTRAEVQATPARSEVPPLLGWLSRGTGDSGWPSIPRSLARGALTVGSSPVLLLVPFLFVFAAWVGLVMLGLEGPVLLLANMAAVPPIGTFFDLAIGESIFGQASPVALAATAGLIVARSAFLAVVSGLIVEALEGAPSASAGLRRGSRAFPALLAVNVISFSAILASRLVLPLLGPQFAFLGSILVFAAVVYYLAAVPAAAIREGRGVQETLRRSARAAAMPGSRHLILSVIYVFVAYPPLILFTPHGNQLSVNPFLATWIYALVAAFIHMSFLAAFCYRWMAIEPEVPAQPVPRRR